MSRFLPRPSRTARRAAALATACVLLTLSVSLAAVGPAAGAAAGDTVYIDVLYMIDVSGSVIGLGHSQGDILPELIEALVEEVYLTVEGTTVIIATFSEGILDVDGPGGVYEGIWSRTVTGATREEIVAYIEGLNEKVREPQGHGQVTALYDSAREALAYLDQLRQQWNRNHPEEPYESTHLQKVIIFTDGMDNGSKTWTREDFLGEFERLRTEGPMRDRLFVKLVTAPGVNLGLEGIQEEKSYSTRTVELIGLPGAIDFGNLSALENGETLSRAIDFSAQRPVPAARIEYTWGFEGLPADALDLVLNPSVIDGTPTHIRVEVTLRILDREALSRALLRDEGKSCTGWLALSTSNPRVSFLPSRATLAFSYEPTGTVTLRPVSESGTAFPRLGRPTGEPKSTSLSYLLDFDGGARTSALTVEADFRWAVDNPADLEALAGGTGSTTPLVGFTWSPGGPPTPLPGPVTLDPSVETLEVVITLQPEMDEQLPGGTYAGYLVLSVPPSAVARTDGQQSSPDGRLEIPVTASVAHPPLPWWVWLIAGLALALLALIVYQRTRPRFGPDDRLSITYGDGSKDSVDLFDYARTSRWGPAFVTLGGFDADIPLRTDEPIGELQAARGPCLAFRPDPETVTAAAGDGRTFTINGEAAASRAYRLEDGAEIRYGDTRIVCSLALGAGIGDSLDLEF